MWFYGCHGNTQGNETFLLSSCLGLQTEQGASGKLTVIQLVKKVLVLAELERFVTPLRKSRHVRRNLNDLYQFHILLNYTSQHPF